MSLIEKPIIVLGCNRSGTTLLFRNLSSHPSTWSLYDESQPLFYRYYPFSQDGGDSVTHACSEEGYRLIRDLYDCVHNKEYFQDTRVLERIPLKLIQRPMGSLYKSAPLRVVEKTPANCLRVPLLASLFPDAKFLMLVRRPEDVISSLMEGWKNWSGAADSEWRFGKWHYLAPAGWREWRSRSLQEICAFQWIESNRIALDDLRQYCGDRFLLLKHEDLMSQPFASYGRICEFLDLPDSEYFVKEVVGAIESRIFTTGGSRPERDKWMRLHRDEIESVRPLFTPLLEELYGSGM